MRTKPGAQAATGAQSSQAQGSPEGADQRKRVAADNWERMPDFDFKRPDGGELARGALPGLAVILAWLALAGGLLVLQTRRLGGRR